MARIIERTLYPDLVAYLKKLGFGVIGEAALDDSTKATDQIFSLEDEEFIIDEKIESKSDKFQEFKALAQVVNYGRLTDIKNLIVLIYPAEMNKELIISPEWLTKRVLKTPVRRILQTKYWTDWDIKKTATVEEIFQELHNKITTKTETVNLDSIIKELSKIIRDLNTLRNSAKQDELAKEITRELDLFSSISQISGGVKENQITDLASFLLFNQLLFYRIYRQRVEDSDLPPLSDVKNPIKDLQNYFNLIKNKGYHAIYNVNILKHIQDNPQVNKTINKAIKSFRLINANMLTHDVVGRFFHELIPHDAAKVLATFYTHPNAAAILAGLAIKHDQEIVYDPACGSGTLLVSCYHAKQNFYEKRLGKFTSQKMHQRFLEQEIYGSDVMPFAAHLSTINLALQKIEEKTNDVKIYCMDSLLQSYRFKDPNFTDGKGMKVESLQKLGTKTLDHFFDDSPLKNIPEIDMEAGGAVSTSGAGVGFFVKPFDVIIMNPPFTANTRFTDKMREKIKNNKHLTELVGGSVHLWGFFLALSYLGVKLGGTVAAVLPISVARGADTQGTRDLLMKEFSTRFIIKPVEDKAFSESADFKDILYIGERRKITDDDKTGIVLFKSSVRELTSDRLSKIIDDLRRNYANGDEEDNDDYELKIIKTRKLEDYADNWIPLMAYKTFHSEEPINQFYNKVAKKAGNKFRKIEDEDIHEGLHFSPAGLSTIVSIRNPMGDESRIKKAPLLILKEKKKNSLIVKIKKTEIEYEIPISHTVPSLSSMTSLKTITPPDVDYIITQPIKKHEEIIQLSKWDLKKHGKFPWTKHNMNVEKQKTFNVLASRVRPDSKDTHILAAYFPEKFVSPHTLKILNCKDSTEGKFQNLILNSSINVANLLRYRSLTTGYITLSEEDYYHMDIFDISKLNDSEKSKLNDLHKKLEKIEFPSLQDQYTTNNKYRRMLDEGILEVIGMKKSEIDNLLDKFYPVVAKELDMGM